MVWPRIGGILMIDLFLAGGSDGSPKIDGGGADKNG